MTSENDARDSFNWAEIDVLLQRLEDQFATQQILQSRFLDLCGEQGQKLSPVALREQLPPLRAKKAAKELIDNQDSTPTILDESWWPTGLAEPTAMVPQTGWRCISMRFEHAKALGISVCGMSAEKSLHIVEMIAKRQEAERDFRPVFLTDSLDFSILIPYGFAIEYLPPKQQRDHTRRPADWKNYLNSRREFIIRKWNLQEIIQFGPVAFGE